VDCEAALRGRVMASGGRLLLFFYRRPAAEAAGGGVASECAWVGSGCRPCWLAGAPEPHSRFPPASLQEPASQ